MARWRWPWRRETRSAGGGYSDEVVAAIEAAAARKAATVTSTAAIEAAAGALSRAFSAAEVQGAGWVRDAVSPPWLAQVGRSLVREGASLSVIDLGAMGDVELTPAAQWNFEGHAPHDDAREADWQCRATTFGPSSSATRLLPRDRVVYVRWGTSPGTRHRGQSPASWAAHSAKLAAEAERSLGDEAAGPLAQLLAIPQDGGDGGDDDPLAPLKRDLKAARGDALLLETTSAGWGAGRAEAPGVGNTDWRASRLGPTPPDSMIRAADAGFSRMLAACGVPPGLFAPGADGTAMRESLRQWFMGTVRPMARLVEHELSARLETAVTLRFDNYPTDLQGRAATFQKLVAGGVSVNEALATSGLLADGD